jgi:hypothetical protein
MTCYLLVQLFSSSTSVPLLADTRCLVEPQPQSYWLAVAARHGYKARGGLRVPQAMGRWTSAVSLHHASLLLAHQLLLSLRN